MSKELEALRKIGSLSTQTYTENGISVTLTSQLVKDNCEYKIIEKALTPPTQEEVCKALSDYYGREVMFEENVFWYKSIIYDNELWIRDVSFKDLAKDNRGDLITLIGRFYKGVEQK